MHQFLFYNEFIIHLYMFRAKLCPSSRGQNFITQHLAPSHSAGGRPMHSLGEDAVIMGTIVLETCRGV